MNFKNKLFILIVLLSLALSACSGAAPDAMDKPADAMPEDAMMEKPTEEAMDSHDAMPADTETGSSDETMADDAMMDTPAWFSVPMTNIHTGETFTINDLQGKVILVETMAVWCSNCFRQQNQVKALHEALGERDDFVSLGMDIDPNEDAAKLLAFTESNGFDWMYVVSPAEVARDFPSLYGQQFLNPPSTPMLIIDRHGAAHTLPFGIKSADDLMQALQPFLDEAM